jgi:hypothetical protein
MPGRAGLCPGLARKYLEKAEQLGKEIPEQLRKALEGGQ